MRHLSLFFLTLFFAGIVSYTHPLGGPVKILSKTVLHDWIEPAPDYPVNVGKGNKVVVDNLFHVSSRKYADILKGLNDFFGTIYSLEGLAEISVSAQPFAVRGKTIDYNAYAYAELTSDQGSIEAPDYTNVVMKTSHTPDSKSYEYGEIVKTSPDGKAKAKAVKKKHSVFGEGKKQRSFDLYISVKKIDVSTTSPTPLDANPWAKVTLEATAKKALQQNIGDPMVSVTPKCAPKAKGHKCAPEQGNEANNARNIINLDFLVLTTDNTPDCNLCTDGCSACPTTGACGHTYANSEASNHAWGTAPCGDNTHVGYLCQINASDHEWVYESCSSYHAHYECDGTEHSLQASCSETDSNGNTCTVTSFYACESHTHVYPAPTVSCARQACSQQVSNRFEHRQTCSAGHTYWTCISGATHNHTTVFTCSRPGCSVTFTLCSNGTCNSNWGTHPWHWAQ